MAHVRDFMIKECSEGQGDARRCVERMSKGLLCERTNINELRFKVSVISERGKPFPTFTAGQLQHKCFQGG